MEPQATRSDAEGRYAFQGLEPGAQAVQSRSLEHALWSGEVSLSTEETSRLDIQLRRGLVVRGRATFADGTPAAKATVVAYPEPLDELFLQSGQIEETGVLDPPAALTDEEGLYLLRNAPPGETWLYAVEPRKNRFDPTELVRYTKANLDQAPGSEAVWDPVLSEGSVLEGHAYYSDGAPITGVFALLDSADGDTRGAAVNDEGFRFTNLGEGPYSLRIQMWEKPAGANDPFLEGLVPGGPPVKIYASFAEPREIEPARVEVQWVDEGKRSKGHAQVEVQRVDRYGRISGTEDGSTWSFEISRPGSYRAVVLERRRVVATGETFRIEGGEKLVLPTLRSQAGGTLVLQLERPPRHSTEGLHAYVRSAPNGPTESFSLEEGESKTLANLEPGKGLLTLFGGQVAQLELEYEVVAGEDTTLHVPLIPAVAVPFEVHWPLSEGRGPLLVRFTDRNTGQVAHEVDIDDIAGLVNPASWEALLPVGSYKFEVRRSGVVRTSENFEVTSLDAYEAPSLASH